MIHIQAPVLSEGAGARVHRPFPSSSLRWPLTDPFLLLDEFVVEAHAGFPDHPHRGFEIITYLLEGGFEHRDSLGNIAHAPAGSAMHFVTGSGVIHSEMPLGNARGIQLWINLPRSLKAIPPSLRVITPDQIPITGITGGTIHHIASPAGPIQLHTNVTYDIVVFDDAGGSHSWEVPDDGIALTYVITGCLDVNGTPVQHGELCLVEQGLVSLTSSGSAHAVVLRGTRHHEAVRFNGPFVD
jgi:redox-sensitive bicupin YhaK (pirin superfamily)